MNPATPPLPELVVDLVASGDPLEVAYGHNYRFEERVSEPRQAAYESALRLPAADLKAWRSHHKDYLYRKVYLGRGAVPETFIGVNVDALVTGLDADQWVVRVERFDEVLAGLETDLPTVDAQLDALRRNDGERVHDARAFLEELCIHWNGEVRRQDRPAFAAFLDDVEREIEAAGWANRLRNRLGLSHYDVPDRSAPLAVALVRYRVAEVLAAAGDDHRERAFAVPTVLDGELNGHFFPSPKGIEYGRSLDLEPDDDCERLVAEVLHRRIDYRPEHLHRVGWISEPIPPYSRGRAFARLRNGHLFCLRYESEREDFGADIPESPDA